MCLGGTRHNQKRLQGRYAKYVFYMTDPSSTHQFTAPCVSRTAYASREGLVPAAPEPDDTSGGQYLEYFHKASRVHLSVRHLEKYQVLLIAYPLLKFPIQA
ncbi:unnamed protein product [Parascedosporium putredinis]|uniref:Uncharacterized protein n=1 Tax=Parascedosporium putredinis TaxID=1442378 RepID=A0A9P1H288_9PEZI|nr:unnamed protein product [Parascedosporium putredinis]CAI7994696.1 unnamed protein product [Parascedosporium putredinis]